MSEQVNDKKPVAAKAAESASAAPAAAPAAASAADVDEKKLSNKELKELKKKEKAAKRAAQKTAIGISPEDQKKIAEQKIEKKKQQTATVTKLKKQMDQTLIKPERRKVPHLFGHLETREQRNASSPTISHIVHPAILSLTLKYSNYKIVGSNSRLRHMLLVFKRIIEDYVTPENTTLTRHLTGHLSHQIEYLKSGRPLSVSMGNAIRWLKQEISHISIDTTEEQAKEILCGKIDDFIKEKIEFSDRLIVDIASKHIADGSTVLTYGHSQVLEELFQYCVTEQGKKFKLIVVDSRPLFEGKKLVKNLANTYFDEDVEINDLESMNSKNVAPVRVPITKTHVSIQYVLLNSLASSLLDDVDYVFLGAHAMLSNGRLYSRVGTALIAMMAHTRNIPVLTCCESIKFSDKVQLDSVTTNELADSDDLVNDIASNKPPQKKSFALEQFIKQAEAEADKNKSKQQPKGKGGNQPNEEIQEDEDSDPLKNWKDLPALNILNIMYDLTPPEYIDKVITELGSLPPSSVPVILREYKNT
ncbi:tif224 [[Candida] subhashii]|uniref:Tif224 n=1 Tax=[Candida] subhashii TaxID=561895 RepID=A0A8J5R6B1_9ASCO|nr:tif224 [[Candida] subhashii]KAG7665680.1 tif224 [[Candida] subhashii]